MGEKSRRGVVGEEGSRVVVGNEDEENKGGGGGGGGSAGEGGAGWKRESNLKFWMPLTHMCLLSWPQLFLVVDCSSC